MATRILGKIRNLGYCLIVVFPSVALAGRAEDGGGKAATPPVGRASFHQLVFANEDIAVLNNRYPPGGDSGFHSHHHDIFYVVIEAAPSRGQSLGKPLADAPFAPAGSAGYSPIGPEPRVHRIVNGDEGPSQYVVVEILRAAPAGDAVSSREGAPHYVGIVDNARLRAWRLILEPGQSAPAITQGGDGVRIVVHGGLLTTTAEGAPDQTLALQAGEFAIQNSGSTRAVRNSGTETIELIELELK